MTVKKFDDIRKEIDLAIRKGLTLETFLAENNIDRGWYYRQKPKNFSWRKIQKELGIKADKQQPGKKKALEKEERDFKIDYDKIPKCEIESCEKYVDLGETMCAWCKLNILESVIGLYKKGFKFEDIKKALG